MFIAVIIETFAEIRVQFQQTWSTRLKESQEEHVQVKEEDIFILNRHISFNHTPKKNRFSSKPTKA